MANKSLEPFPPQAMPAKKPTKSHRARTISIALVLGLFLFLLLDKQSFLRAIIVDGASFSWDAVFATLAAYGYVLFVIYIVLAGVALFLENRNPDRTLAWLLVLALLPVVGFVLYWFVGPNFRYQADKRRFRLPRPVGPLPCIPPEERVPLVEDTVQLVYRSSGARLVTGEDIRLFHDGRTAFARIKERLEGAKRSILIESYIIKNDGLGNEIKDILIERAKAGVFVCVIYDAVGSWRMGKKYPDALRGAGVWVHAFLPVAFPMFRGANYRNHRKIMVVDGETGFTGGLNIGDEYVSKSAQYSYWRDTHMECSGYAVNELTDLFLNDLAACGLSGTLLQKVRDASAPEKGLAFVTAHEGCPANHVHMQIVASGPDTPWDTVQKAYFSVFTRAREKLWITTPYLVPGDALLQALCLASLSGVDVRLLIPAKADQHLVQWANMNCCDELLRAGVRIFMYDRKRFVHAKTLTCDGVLMSVGSANLDTRSLQINFEVQAFVYDKTLALLEEAAFKNDMKYSRELSLTSWRARPKLEKIKESVGKLFSSLL